VVAGEILDMRMLDINNQDCIRKRKNRAYLGRDSFRKSFVRGRILSSTNLKLKRQIGKIKKEKDKYRQLIMLSQESLDLFISGQKDISWIVFVMVSCHTNV